MFVERSIVFVWKWGPGPRTSSRCYHGNKSAATFKKGIFVHPPWVPNCMQNLKGGWKFSFPKMFDSYKDLFLRSRKKHVFVPSYRGKVGKGEGKGSQNIFWPFKEYQFCLLICHNSDPSWSVTLWASMKWKYRVETNSLRTNVAKIKWRREQNLQITGCTSRVF